MKENKSKAKIYCGPNLNGELKQFSLYKNGIPKHIERHIEGCPEIEMMFYSIHELTRVRDKIKEQGSRENQLYNKIKEYQEEVK